MRTADNRKKENNKTEGRVSDSLCSMRKAFRIFAIHAMYSRVSKGDIYRPLWNGCIDPNSRFYIPRSGEADRVSVSMCLQVEAIKEITKLGEIRIERRWI